PVRKAHHKRGQPPCRPRGRHLQAADRPPAPAREHHAPRAARAGGRGLMPGATAAATAAYRAAHADLPEAHFRTLDPLAVASIGLGTYLGVEDDRIDRGYGQAIVDAVNSGCNLLDTAINYRGQRSERVIGQALVALE